MDLIRRRKKNWIGHILTGKSLLREVIGKRPRAGKRLGMLNEFLKKASYAELKRKVENRKENIEVKKLPNGRTLTTSLSTQEEEYQMPGQPIN